MTFLRQNPYSYKVKDHLLDTYQNISLMNINDMILMLCICIIPSFSFIIYILYMSFGKLSYYIGLGTVIGSFKCYSLTEITTKSLKSNRRSLGYQRPQFNGFLFFVLIYHNPSVFLQCLALYKPKWPESC